MMDESIVQWVRSEYRLPHERTAYEQLLHQDEQLVRAGFPALSPWWREQIGALYAGGKTRLVARVGRRGGKSSSACRFAVAEALYGQHSITPGDIGIYAFFSVKKSDAQERIRTIGAILAALKVPYESSSTQIKIKDRPIAFRVYAASFRTIVGGTWIGFVADEVARWRDEESGKNPATEVLTSARPALATQPYAKELLLSSPWSTLDAHYDAVEAGPTDEQHVAVAPSWVANPTLTESRCRELEPDGATFDREYGAVPMASGAQYFFDHNALKDACREYTMPVPVARGVHVTAGADFGFKRDSSAVVVAHRNGRLYQIADMLELSPSNGVALVPSEVCRQFAERVRGHAGLAGVMADAHYRESIQEHLADFGLSLFSAPTDVPSTYVRARTLLHQACLILPKDKQLIRDLAEVQAAPTASGRLSMRLPKRVGGGHADRVSALILAIWQKAGAEKKDEQKLPKGWTQAELDDVERIVRRRQEEREDWGGGSPYDDDPW